MTHTQRRMFKRTARLGVLLTLIITAADAAGFLDPLERYFYDLRARRCQYFTPPPSEKIIHLDIDDQSLGAIGRWPWPRATMARLIDEISRAGAKVIALDILYGNPERPEFHVAEDQRVSVTDHDVLLAEAIRKAGNVLVPVSVSFSQNKPPSSIERDAIELMMETPELGAPQLQELLRSRGHRESEIQTSVNDEFLSLAEQALSLRLERELESQPQADLDSLAQKLLPQSYSSGERSNARVRLEKVFPVVVSVLHARSFGQPVPSGLNLLKGNPSEATIPIICDAAGYLGFVDFLPSSDGDVRVVPLAANYRGRLLPHMSLATACAMLGVDPKQVIYTANSATIPLPDASPIVVPLRTLDSPQYGAAGAIMNVPWFGGGNWLTMYDAPRCAEPRQHETLMNVWKICQYDDDIARNETAAYSALGFLIKLKSPIEHADFVGRWSTLDANTRETLINQTLQDPFILDLQKMYQSLEPKDLDNEGRQFLSAFAVLQPQARAQLISRSQQLRQQQLQARAALHDRLQGRAVIVGWTATGGGDSYPTSLHAQCPGVVIQSTIVNAILTRHFWRTEPWWTVAIVTIALGSLVTLIVGWLPPWRALFLTVLLGAGYAAFNGLVLFDWGNRDLGIAAPLVAATVVWGGLTLAREIFEAAERSRITRSFRSYVDPAVVDYVIENPDVRLDGQEKEMSVVFTDLAGFTTLSEALRAQTVPLLNEYMGIMVPIIHANRGLRNKFLGDGIMFFFSAPKDNPSHAKDAVDTVLQMQSAMQKFNEGLKSRGLPSVSMRAGITSGLMVVGDAGSLDDPYRANDYTVLGDVVNLGARLESANKATGTQMLLNDRARQLIGDHDFLVRPIGNLQVVGKTEGVMTFEALCRKNDATPEQQKLAELTTRVVAAYQAAKFQKCIDAARELEAAFGESKLTSLYLELSERYLKDPPTNGWNGQIVLFEK